MRLWLVPGMCLRPRVQADRVTGTVTGTAFCGAFTTYSTFSYETFRLAEDRAWLFASLNVGASIIAALGAAYFGMAIAQAITG